MTPQEALNNIKAILQPSVITQLASSGTIESWKQIDSLIQVLEKELFKDQSPDSGR